MPHQVPRHAHTDMLKPYMCTREPSRTHEHTRACLLMHTPWYGVPQARGRPPPNSSSQPGRTSWLPATVPGAAPVHAPRTRSPSRLRAAPLSSGQRS